MPISMKQSAKIYLLSENIAQTNSLDHQGFPISFSIFFGSQSLI